MPSDLLALHEDELAKAIGPGDRSLIDALKNDFDLFARIMLRESGAIVHDDTILSEYAARVMQEQLTASPPALPAIRPARST
jgi:hypothetical protein